MTATVTTLDTRRLADARRRAVVAVLLESGPMRAKQIGKAVGMSVQQAERYIDWGRRAGVLDRHDIVGLTARGISVAFGYMPMPKAPKRYKRTSADRPLELTEYEIKWVMDLYGADVTVEGIARTVRRDQNKVAEAIRAATGKDQLRWRSLNAPGSEPAHRRPKTQA